MDATEKEAFLLSLIRDDVINRKLVSSFRNLGINADQYMLYLSDTIFRLLQIPDEEEDLYIAYESLTQKADYIDISRSNAPLDSLVKQIYALLLAYGHETRKKQTHTH